MAEEAAGPIEPKASAASRRTSGRGSLSRAQSPGAASLASRANITQNQASPIVSDHFFLGLDQTRDRDGTRLRNGVQDAGLAGWVGIFQQAA